MLTSSIKTIINKLLFKKSIISYLSKIEKAVKTLTNVLKIFINFSLYLIDTFFKRYIYGYGSKSLFLIKLLKKQIEKDQIKQRKDVTSKHGFSIKQPDHQNVLPTTTTSNRQKNKRAALCFVTTLQTPPITISQCNNNYSHSLPLGTLFRIASVFLYKHSS